MKYRESEEMYLETILILHERKACVHAVDVAAELGYAKSSVSRAMGLLHDKGYITVAQTGEITLTDVGKAKAEDVYDRHNVLTALLMGVGADREMAEENACRIEHVISAEMFRIIKDYVNGKKEGE